MHVFVISLKDETKRREAISKHLNERGFSFSFFEATDGRPMDVLKTPNYDFKRRRRCHGRDLRPGEIGCLLSHQRVYQKMLDDNLDYAFIVEDDAVFHEDTKATIDSLMSQNIKFDVVRLFGDSKVAKSVFRKVAPLYKDFWLVRLRTTPGGTQAQIVSKSGAEKLLKSLKTFTFPVDTIHGRCWETGIESYSIQPGLAHQDQSFESAIGDERFNKKSPLKGFERLIYKINRPLFKISEAIGKRWIYYSKYPTDLAIRKKFG